MSHRSYPAKKRKLVSVEKYKPVEDVVPRPLQDAFRKPAQQAQEAVEVPVEPVTPAVTSDHKAEVTKYQERIKTLEKENASLNEAYQDYQKLANYIKEVRELAEISEQEDKEHLVKLEAFVEEIKAQLANA